MVLGLTSGGQKVSPKDGVKKRGSGGSVKIDSGKSASQTADAAEFESSRFYGVKNYLNQFYEDAEDGQHWLLLPPEEKHLTRKERCLNVLVRITFVLGILVLLSGAALIIFAYVYPKPTLDERLDALDSFFQFDEEREFAELTREDIEELMQDPFHNIKLAGIILLAIGGCLLVTAVLPHVRYA